MAVDGAAVTMLGIAKILGVGRSTLYDRIQAGTYSLDTIPMRETSRGNFYPLDAVLRKQYPDADDNTIALMMFQFTLEYGRYVR